MSKEIDYNYLEETKNLKANLELGFIELGGRFMKIRNERLWSSAGYDTFDLWLEEIQMSESQVSKLISIYNKFYLQFPVPEEKLLLCGGWSQLAEILPLVKDQKSANKYIDLLISGDRKGIRDKIREDKTGVVMEKCRHDYYRLDICRKCGDKQRIYEDD